MDRVVFKRALNATTSLSIVLLTSTALPAYGQEAPPVQTSAQEVDEIIVTGYRSSNLAEIKAKRLSDGILDAVSQDQAGLLPDVDVTQLAQRIPGLSVISAFGSTNDRSTDDGEEIVIRGLRSNFNLTTFDGVPIASTDEDDRRTKTSIFPPSAISRVEAIKTLTADRNPHGLSGQVNLVTASAFETDGPYLSTRLSIGQNSTAGDVVDDHGPDIRADVAFSNRFGANDQIGFVAAGSFHRFSSTNRENKPGTRDDTYLFFVPDVTSDEQTENFAESNGFVASRRNQIFAFQDQRERISGVVKFEYEPSEATATSIFYGHFEEDEDEQRWEYLANGDDDNRPLNQTARTGTWEEGRLELGFVSQPEKTTVDILTGKFDHSFSSQSKFSGALSYSKSQIDVIRNMSKFRPSSNSDGAFSYDITSGTPSLTWTNPDAVNDLSRYGGNYIRARTQDVAQDVLYGALDFSHNFEPGNDGLGFSAGASLLKRDQSFDREYREGDVFNTVGCTEADVTDCPLATLDQFVLGTTLPGLGSDVPFYLIDDAAYRSAWAAQGEPITNDRTDNAISSDYTLDENILGLYAQAVYRADRLTVRGGLRYDKTDANTDLFARDRALDDDPDDAAQYVPVSRESTYDFLLPSIVGSVDLTDNVKLRLGYGRTIGRPNFDEYARGESIGVPDNGRVSISRGNPDLKPLVSDNFDASLEYYFDGGSSLASVAVFHKEVKDLIFVKEETIENFQFESQSLTAEVRQPVNANDARISGVELSVRKDFEDTLPAPFDGFVLQSNLTLLDGEVTLPNDNGADRVLDGWEKQPEFIFNAQLSYEKGPFGAKVAYNYVDDFINNADDENELYDVFRAARSEVDLQARYKVSDSLKLLFEVQNLTKEDNLSVRRFSFGELTASETQKGRRIWVGFKWRPGLGK